MDAVLHGVPEKVDACEGEGGHEQGGAADVLDDIMAAVGLGQKSTSFASGEAGVRQNEG